MRWAGDISTANGEGQKCIQNFNLENLKDETIWMTQTQAEVANNINMDLKEQCVCL